MNLEPRWTQEGISLARLALALLLLAHGSVHAALLFQERFEGPGYENSGWVEIGLPDPDYNAPALEGTNSLHLAGVELVRRSFSYSDNFHLYFRVLWNRWDAYNNVIDWEDATTATTASIYADNDKLLLLHGRASALGRTSILENTVYHLWLDWTRGSGVDGTMQLFLSTDGFKPAEPEAVLTNGTGTAVDRMYVGPASPGADVVFDSFLVSDGPMGDTPDANRVPTLSEVSNQTMDQDTSLSPIGLTVSDAETEAAALVLTAWSSDPALVPANALVLGGSGRSRTLTITPSPGAIGVTTITLRLSDGNRMANGAFLLTVRSTNQPPGSEFFLTEWFDGPGYETPGWEEIGTPNPDYTNIVLEGSESLHCSGPQLIRRPFRSDGGFHFYLEARWNTYAPYNTVLLWEDASTSISACLYADLDRLLLVHGQASALGTTRIEEGTAYHLWVDWALGTGSNGTMQLFISTNGTKPLTAEAMIMDGTGLAVDRLYVGPSGAGPDMLFDRLLASSQPIGSNPNPHLAPIQILLAPRDTLGLVGRAAVLRVAAGSDLPLRYQWEKAGVEIPGATNDSLSFAALHFSDAGYFAVRLDNGEIVVRAGASLEVLPALPRPRFTSIQHNGLHPVLTFGVVSGATYHVEYRDSASGLEWLLLATITGTGGTESVVDPGEMTPSRVYRVWAE
ncbi:MAG TPA: hypothetical protein VNH84_06215 [Candidatus Saccharimonadales bacterium]|nr:hypothetical protein [Candidatus Saccharimonadales bacterium]